MEKRQLFKNKISHMQRLLRLKLNIAVAGSCSLYSNDKLYSYSNSSQKSKILTLAQPIIAQPIPIIIIIIIH